MTVCHERHHEKWRRATVREMRGGPSKSAIRCRLQTTELRCWLERTESHGGAAREVLPFGVPELDRHLRGGAGWRSEICMRCWRARPRANMRARRSVRGERSCPDVWSRSLVLARIG